MKKWVLIADSKPKCYSQVRRKLIANGYDVFHVSSIEDAMDHFDIRTADLLLLDLDVPGNKICSDLSALSQLNPGVRIIGVTERSKGSEIALRERLDGVAEKPFALGSLISFVQELLKNPPPCREFRYLAPMMPGLHAEPRIVHRVGDKEPRRVIMKTRAVQPNSHAACVPSFPVVLYIDDNENDRILVRLAAQSAKVALEFRCLGDISEGMDYLAGKGRFGDRQQHPLPVFILLDYYLHGHIGPEFLGWLRARPQLAAIPVCVYSDTDESEPIGRSYRAGAGHFLTKATSFDRLRAVVGVLASCAATAPPCLDLLRELPEHRRLG